jgi:DNA-binding NarL/FixJ family response regulator
VIRVVVADDQSIVRRALVALVSMDDDIEVVGEAADGRDAVALTTRYRPDVVLMDVRMPVLDGIEATRRIRSEVPGTAVLVLTTYDLDEYVFNAIRAGASGFLLKDGDGDDLVDAVRRSAAGDAVMDPGALRRLLLEFARGPAPDAGAVQLVHRLSSREREVLGMIARGASNDEIAEGLCIARPTVKTHVGALLAKLEVRDRTQAAVVAHRAGLE